MIKRQKLSFTYFLKEHDIIHLVQNLDSSAHYAEHLREIKGIKRIFNDTSDIHCQC